MARCRWLTAGITFACTTHLSPVHAALLAPHIHPVAAHVAVLELALVAAGSRQGAWQSGMGQQRAASIRAEQSWRGLARYGRTGRRCCT